jgi:copper homeostasis protein
MPKSLVLEICVESVDCALAAERGGAHRVELCSNLLAGGTTPEPNVMQSARKTLRLPIHALIRPRPGDFVYSPEDLETLRAQISLAKDLGMDGIVLGVLDKHDRVDIEQTRKLVEFSDPLPVTFHRAFDLTPDLSDSLEAVILTGAKRILTAGGAVGAEQNTSALAQLVRRAGDRIAIMPGGGIAPTNVIQVVHRTGVREIHTSLGASARKPSNTSNPSKTRSFSGERRYPAFEREVRGFVQLLANLENHGTREEAGR